MFDFSRIVVVSDNFDENLFKSFILTLKHFKIYPQKVLFSRTPISGFASARHPELTLSRELVQKFDFPFLVYDRKDRFSRKQMTKGVQMSRLSSPKIKGRIYVSTMEQFLANIQLDSGTYHSFLGNMQVTSVYLLSNRIFNEEGRVRAC